MSAREKSNEQNSSYDAYDVLFESTSDIFYVVDSNMILQKVSLGFIDFFDWKNPEDITGKPLKEGMKNHEIARKHIRDCKKVLKNGKNLKNLEETITDICGNARYFLSSKYVLKTADDLPEAVLCMSYEITREYEVKKDYEDELNYLLQLRADTYGAVLIDISEHRICDMKIHEGAEEIAAKYSTLDEYISNEIERVSGNEDLLGFLNAFSLDTLMSIYQEGRRRMDFEYVRTMNDGSRCWVRLIVRLRREPGKGNLMALVSLTDITKAKTAESRLIKAAELDSMTGILNHDTTFSQIERFLAGEGAAGTHALIMVDRDNLKMVNDTLGHKAGDEVIIETADTLQRLFRDTDIVGRVGGDEFLVLMKNIGKPKKVRRKAAELLQSLQCICGPAESAIETTGSIGISFYKGDYKNLNKLYAEADAALYKAKTQGRNRCVLFNADSSEEDETLSIRDSFVDTVNLKTLLNSIDGGILILHAEDGKKLRPVFFSDSFLTMMGGLTQNEAFELYSEDIFRCIHPEERERVTGEFSDAMERGELLRTTYRLMGKDGKYHWLSVGTNIIKNDDEGVDIYAVHTNIEKLMHHREKLAVDEQRFRMAFTQTSQTIYEVDIPKATLTFHGIGNKKNIPETSISGLPQSLLDMGFVDKDSGEAFKEFYSEICSGKEEGKGLFQCRYLSNGNMDWASISYKVVFDSAGRAEKAIGIIEELPNIGRAQAQLKREELLMKAVRGDLLASMKINLSNSTIEYINTQENAAFNQLITEKDAAVTELVTGESPYGEDGMLQQINLSYAGLVRAYTVGKTWISIEYRRMDGGEIRWTKATASLVEEPVSRELYAFLYVRDVEKRRSIEAILPVAVQKDSVTHLYTQSTVEKMINSLMRGGGPADRLYSLAIIRMVGIPEAAARVGAENVDMEKMYLSRFLCVLLDDDCIIGGYGSNSILVFCPSSESDRWMNKKIENAVMRVNEIRTSEDSENHIRLICGISTERARNADLAGMIAQAVQICDNYQNSDVDKVYSFEEYVESFRISDEELNKSAFVVVEPRELSRPLFGIEKEAMSNAMEALLSADHYDAAINGAIEVVGKYYDAQRVYSLALTGDGKAVSGLHEWAAVGRHGILRQMTGLSLAKLPALKKALTVAKPIILDGAGKRVNQNGENPWRFIILPIIAENKTQGFFCIENPKKHKSDIALPYTLIPILMHERKRFNLTTQGVNIFGRDTLTGLPDKAAFQSAIQSFNTEAYHSIGVLYVSAVDLRRQNLINGEEYADDMLVFAARVMIDLVPKAQIYRISGSEFVMICTNLSREAFQAQSARCQSVLLRRYPKSFLFGEAWSNEKKSPRKLLKEAEALVGGGAKTAEETAQSNAITGERKAILLEGLSQGRFFIYLQPQVDMRSGKIVGAEALARYRDETGQIILPRDFISLLEEEGRIRELDYLILDKAFQTIQEWISAGLEPIPLSVNFSKQTILSGTVLASVLAIRSRYDVPDGLIKIEVTEYIGDDESEAIPETMEEMREQGFRFALDDLGSEYSGLKTLSRLTFDELKLDRTLISNFLFNSMSRSIVESIVGVCGKNSIKCVAEGVESKAQAEELLEVGCIYAQGYYYGKPTLPSDFSKKYLK